MPEFFDELRVHSQSNDLIFVKIDGLHMVNIHSY